ncbi:beta-lactamase family protein [Ketobacter sp. MCCC 1A13808]|uniref:serine hydrolase domain-containing protein n=1 Tax=Ketobacter sp. MCCC 1A13808 TaxID=2602738 RepID=UPI000F254D5F|nr:serine hydrolase domain-containing protein [Ketobacter sp. MCCC 1A13808]MVF11303.1 beta-lactamase family protein [Ketobacter sp. MCCC 1A13808]RLP53567.1 MAG: class A beta-lactamase-related serine hydrolase [Ketobacter sp.]
MTALPNLFGRIENNIQIPRSLKEISTIADNEMSPEWLGLTDHDRDVIWKAVKNLYRTGAYPALSICIRRHGEILLNRSIGHAQGNGPGERGPKVMATPDTPFCLFSASKAVTAMLIHLLEERNQINLMNPVSYYVPEFASNGKKRITVQQILSHRAGIASFKDIDPELLFHHDSMMELIYHAEPTAIHGHELAYHALTGGYVLGELVQRLTGDTIAEFLRVNVQEPMGMRNFNYGISAERYPEVATNYLTGLPVVFPMKQFIKRVLGADLATAIKVSNDPRFYQQIIPAGNITATAEECSRFFHCLLSGGEFEAKRIFQPVTVERAVREVSATELDRTLLVPMRYSAGMMLGNYPIGLFGPAAPHAYGHIGLTNNFCWADPERMISVALLTSGNPVLGSHFYRLVNLLTTISRRCKKVFKH